MAMLRLTLLQTWGRRHQSEVVVGAWRAVLSATEYWYPIIPRLHRYTVAVSWVSVNHDDRRGSAEGQPLTPLFGIKGAGGSNARLMFGLISTLLRFLGRLASCTGAGCRFMRCVSLVQMFVPGFTVSVCCGWFLRLLALAGRLLGYVAVPRTWRCDPL